MQPIFCLNSTWLESTWLFQSSSSFCPQPVILPSLFYTRSCWHFLLLANESLHLQMVQHNCFLCLSVAPPFLPAHQVLVRAKKYPLMIMLINYIWNCHLLPSNYIIILFRTGLDITLLVSYFSFVLLRADLHIPKRITGVSGRSACLNIPHSHR